MTANQLIDGTRITPMEKGFLVERHGYEVELIATSVADVAMARQLIAHNDIRALHYYAQKKPGAERRQIVVANLKVGRLRKLRINA